MVMTVTFRCMCKDGNDGSRRHHECTAEDNRRKDVPGYFQFLCSDCSWHAARCLLCDKQLHQWDKTSSASAARHGTKVYLGMFKSHCKTHHAPQEEGTHQQEEPIKRQRLNEYGESTTSGVLEEEGTFTADHPDCDVTFDCETSEKKEGEGTRDKSEDNDERADEADESSVSSKGSDDCLSEFDESELYEERLINTALSDSVHLQNEYDKLATNSNMHLIQSELTKFEDNAYIDCKEDDWNRIISDAEWKELHNKWKSYEELAYFDKRPEEEKYVKRYGKQLPLHCQTQLFFSDKRDVKEKDPNNNLGGIMGAGARADAGNREKKGMMLSHDEAKTVFLYLKLMLELSETNGEYFVRYDCQKANLFRLGTHESDVSFRFPETFAEAQKKFTRGAHSIYKNFPAPQVKTKHGHAYVSLRETIEIMAAHHGRFSFQWDADREEWNREGLNGTKAMDSLRMDILEAVKVGPNGEEFAKKCSIGYVYFWSDSFLRCFIKQKDNSVWILTVTICPPYIERWSGNHTYLLAMGKSSLDHSPIIDHFNEEVKEIMQGFTCYFGDDNKMRDVAFGKLFHSADRPERQMCLNTRKEGAFGKVSNHSCPIPNMFCSCWKCVNRLIRAVNKAGWWNWNVPISQWECSSCFQWEIKPDDPKQAVHPVGKNYPPHTPDFHIGEDKEKEKLTYPKGREPGVKAIGPVRLTAKFMLQACWFGYHARRSGRWTKPQLLEYLRTCNIKQSRVDHIEHLASTDEQNGTYSTIEDLVPRIWMDNVDCFSRCIHPDLGLHGVGHSMIPETMDFIHRILSHWKKFSAFVKHANEILLDVASFQLDWLKLKPLPKLAWLGENSMGFGRLMPYIYGMYFKNAGLNQEHDHHVANIKRLISAFSSVLSVLMMSPCSKKRICSSRIRASMKLFMSSLHYAQHIYGDLKSHETNSGKDKKKKEPDYVAKIDADDVSTLLDKLDMEHDKTNHQTNRNTLRKINVKELKELLGKKGVSDTRGSKAVLQKKLFKHLLGREPVLRGQPPATASTRCHNLQSAREGDGTTEESMNSNDEVGGRSSTGIDNDEVEEIPGLQQAANTRTSALAKSDSSESWVWDKGAFLSFLANIDYQIDFLAVLREIWCVTATIFDGVTVFLITCISHNISLSTAGKEERKLQYGIPSLFCGQCVRLWIIFVGS